MRSLWRHEPSIPVRIYIDAPSRVHLGEWGIPDRADASLEIVDHREPTYSWADKPLALIDHDPRRERVLLLDTDTRVCGPIDDVFALLDRFELAAAHAPVRLGRGQPASLTARAPKAFPELNTGVIAYRKTSAVAQLFERWWALHEEIFRSGDHPDIGDQATFRAALYESNVRFTVLPPEFNCRFTMPTYVHGPVRILHGRASDLGRIERAINGSTGGRVFVPGLGVVRAPGKDKRRLSKRGSPTRRSYRPHSEI